ncbi:TerB family tellurite resistance protein [bacterium]|nr:TerB family tellurite resistance protein [bacterium]
MRQCPECNSYNTNSRTRCFKCNHIFSQEQPASKKIIVDDTPFLDIASAVNIDGEYDTIENIMGSFYIMRNNLPENKIESRIFEDFSLIISSMTLMIHIAMADKTLSDSEQKRIESDMYYQITTGRKSEYKYLSQAFGKYEDEIIRNLFNCITKQYNTGRMNIEKIIDSINLIYRNNIRKRYYFIRICFFCAYADGDYSESEKIEILKISDKLELDLQKVEEIREQVMEEFLPEPVERELTEAEILRATKIWKFLNKKLW